ncbi:MAG: PorV/PorQ family protein [Elusimicrobiota bacterium]
MKALRLIVAVALALASVPAAASDFSSGAVGTSGSQFLLMDTSARGVAMGGAMTAVTNDSSSIYWNPAGLVHVPRLSTSLMHAQYVADITYEAASYAQRIDDTSVIGAGVRYLNGGSIRQTDVNAVGNGTFSPYSFVAELGWGQAIYDLSDSEMELSMGVTARAIHTSLSQASANGYGGDFGVQSRFFASAMTYDLGLAIQNLGSGQRFDQVRDSMPTRIRFGGAVSPIKPLILSLEAIAPINDTPSGAFGVEYSLELERGVTGAARAGINTQSYQSLGAASIINFGLGLKLTNFSFDYAFVPMGVLGTAAHRLSISYNLPAKVSRRYRER